MAWIVRLVSIGAGGAEHSTDVLRIARSGDLTDLASLGLTLAESKQLLAGVQQEIVAAQARVHAAHRPEGTVKLVLARIEKQRRSSARRPRAAALAPVTSAQIAKACARTARYSAAGR